ncbi:MAG: methionyl-tRNA formyltransferase [Janthinobacterium lividum]
MRLAFMGSPAFAVPSLRALHAAGHDVAAVYCQPPRPAGRGQRPQRCAVHEAADALGLPVRTPARLRHDAAEHAAFAALNLDVAAVAAYGLILPPAMLDAPALGCWNVHASLLPRWRGASPIQSALLAGDPETGVTIMRMEPGLDTGPMLLRATTPIGPTTTTPELHDTLAALGAALLLRALAERPPATPQPEGATHAAKLARADGRLDWTQDAATLERRVRALTPWPGTWTTLPGTPPEILKVLAAEPVPDAPAGDAAPGTILDARLAVRCGTGALRLLRVQRPGRAPVDADAFLRGTPTPPGTVLGADPPPP